MNKIVALEFGVLKASPIQTRYRGIAKAICRDGEGARDVTRSFFVPTSQCRHDTDTRKEGREQPCSFLAPRNNVNSSFVSKKVAQEREPLPA